MKLVLRAEGEEIPCIIRPYQADDENLVYDSWLKDFRESEHARRIGNAIYYNNHRELITSLIDGPSSALRVVALEASPTQVLSWALGELEQRALHYVFTKKSWRTVGAARALVAALSIEGGWPQDSELACTHHTHYFDEIRTRSVAWRRRLVFNPYALYRRVA